MTGRRRKIIEQGLVALHVYERRTDAPVLAALHSALVELVGRGEVRVLVNASTDVIVATQAGIRVL